MIGWYDRPANADLKVTAPGFGPLYSAIEKQGGVRADKVGLLECIKNEKRGKKGDEDI